MKINANADMREVWKRLANSCIVLPAQDPRTHYLGHFTDMPGIVRIDHSAMQGCKL